MDWKLHRNVFELRYPESFLMWDCSGKLANLLQAVNLEREVAITSLWHAVRELNRFVGVSAAHDELIASFQQIVLQKSASHVTVEQLRAIHEVLKQLSKKVRLSDETLDLFYDRLEAASFDLGPAF